MKDIFDIILKLPLYDKIATGIIALLIVVFGLIIIIFAAKLGILSSIGPFKFAKQNNVKDEERKALDQKERDDDPDAPEPIDVEEDSIVRAPITAHDVFNKEEYYLNEIAGMDDGSNKSTVNTVFLRDCKFASIYKHLRKFGENVEATNGAELGHFPVVIHHIIQDYERLSKSIEIRVGNKILTGVPSTYIRKFNKWHSPHVSMLLSEINKKLINSYYGDWWIRATVCFDLFDVVLELTIMDAKSALGDMNGELDKEIHDMFCKDDSN